MNAVPRHVKESSLHKWSKPAMMNKKELIKWWEKEGSLSCSFCYYFAREAQKTNQHICNKCPLKDPDGSVCAPEWNALRNHFEDYDNIFHPDKIDMPWVRKMCARLRHRIEQVPVNEEE